jgi:hypothetical protein
VSFPTGGFRVDGREQTTLLDGQLPPEAIVVPLKLLSHTRTMARFEPDWTNFSEIDHRDAVNDPEIAIGLPSQRLLFEVEPVLLVATVARGTAGNRRLRFGGRGEHQTHNCGQRQHGDSVSLAQVQCVILRD